jgi:hypothetical protein
VYKIDIQFPLFSARLPLIAADARDPHLAGAVEGLAGLVQDRAFTPAALQEVAHEAGLHVTRRGEGPSTQVVLGWR